MNYEALYGKKALEEKAKELKELSGAEKVALEQKILKEAEAKLEIKEEIKEEVKETPKKK